MATDPRTIELLLERIAPAGRVSARKMFGEYGLYCDGRFFAVVCDDTLFIKPTAAGLKHAPELELAPPYRGAKASMVVPADRWDNDDWFVTLVRLTVEHLPPPKNARVKPARSRRP